MPGPNRTRRRLPSSGYPNLGGEFNGSKNASIADNASLSGVAGGDFSVVYWVLLTSLAANRNCVNKGAASGNFEFLTFYQTSANGFRVQVSANGTAVTSLTATNFGNPAINTWNLVAATYDGTNVSISVNAGTANTAAFSTDIFNGVDDFTLGRADAGLGNLTGGLDSVGFWKSARGAGGALTTAQIARIYNSGVGVAYRDLDSSQKARLVSWWNLDGNLLDSHGTNHLTNNNSLGFMPAKR